jgi:hypothetical protein
MSSTLSIIYFLTAVSGGNLPSFTGLSAYKDLDTCKAAVSTMTAALPADQKEIRLVCLSSADLEILAKAAGL